MKPKTQVVVTVMLMLTAAALTRYFYPRVEVQVKETVKEVVRTDVRTVTRVVVRPDGTKETVTETVDRSVRTEDSRKSAATYAKSKYLVGAAAGTKFDGQEPVYAVSASARVLGPVFVGLQLDTQKTVYATLTWEF
jgi:hypothetical protein